MTDISFTNLQVNPDAGASPRELKEAQYRLPALPKMSIVFNINAAILSPILTVLFALVNRHAFLENALSYNHDCVFHFWEPCRCSVVYF